MTEKSDQGSDFKGLLQGEETPSYGLNSYLCVWRYTISNDKKEWPQANFDETNATVEVNSKLVSSAFHSSSSIPVESDSWNECMCCMSDCSDKLFQNAIGYCVFCSYDCNIIIIVVIVIVVVVVFVVVVVIITTTTTNDTRLDCVSDSSVRNVTAKALQGRHCSHQDPWTTWGSPKTWSTATRPSSA